MAGQLEGGIPVMNAVRFQLIMMFMITVSVTISTLLGVLVLISFLKVLISNRWHLT